MCVLGSDINLGKFLIVLLPQILLLFLCLFLYLLIFLYGHETTYWFQIGKGVHKGCILSPCLFNLYAEYTMRNTGLEEAQSGIKMAGEISTSDMQITPPLWQKVKN